MVGGSAPLAVVDAERTTARGVATSGRGGGGGAGRTPTACRHGHTLPRPGTRRPPTHRRSRCHRRCRRRDRSRCRRRSRRRRPAATTTTAVTVAGREPPSSPSPSPTARRYTPRATTGAPRGRPRHAAATTAAADAASCASSRRRGGGGEARKAACQSRSDLHPWGGGAPPRRTRTEGGVAGGCDSAHCGGRGGAVAVPHEFAASDHRHGTPRSRACRECRRRPVSRVVATWLGLAPRRVAQDAARTRGNYAPSSESAGAARVSCCCPRARAGRRAAHAAATRRSVHHTRLPLRGRLDPPRSPPRYPRRRPRQPPLTPPPPSSCARATDQLTAAAARPRYPRSSVSPPRAAWPWPPGRQRRRWPAGLPAAGEYPAVVSAAAAAGSAAAAWRGRGGGRPPRRRGCRCWPGEGRRRGCLLLAAPVPRRRGPWRLAAGLAVDPAAAAARGAACSSRRSRRPTRTRSCSSPAGR